MRSTGGSWAHLLAVLTLRCAAKLLVAWWAVRLSHHYRVNVCIKGPEPTTYPDLTCRIEVTRPPVEACAPPGGVGVRAKPRFCIGPWKHPCATGTEGPAARAVMLQVERQGADVATPCASTGLSNPPRNAKRYDKGSAFRSRP